MTKPKLKTITPAIAREMLKCNTHNLPLRQNHIDYLASEMANGRWKLTHQGIAFDGDVLVDGQHRLLAAIQANTTFDAWVFGNIPLSVQELVDKGRVRSIADELRHFDNVNHAKQKVGACRAFLSMCAGFQTVKMSNGLCHKVLKELDVELDFVIDALKGFRPAHASWLIACLAFTLKSDRSLSSFVAQVGNGENLKAGDPAKALRDWLTNSGQNIRNTYKRYAMEGVFNAAFNALNRNKITQVKKGVNGMNYFINRNKKLIELVSDELAQQVAVTQ